MNPALPNRRSIRLKRYDYAQAGAYFVTICVEDGACLFGEIVDGSMRLNEAGAMAAEIWADLPMRFPVVRLDSFVVMPNHLHGLLWLARYYIGAPAKDAPTLGKIIGAYKSLTAVAYVRGVKARAWAPFRERLWQRNYYEHIVRDEEGWSQVRRYIEENPARWSEDAENPANWP